MWVLLQLTINTLITYPENRELHIVIKIKKINDHIVLPIFKENR